LALPLTLGAAPYQMRLSAAENADHQVGTLVLELEYAGNRVSLLRAEVGASCIR